MQRFALAVNHYFGEHGHRMEQCLLPANSASSLSRPGRLKSGLLFLFECLTKHKRVRDGETGVVKSQVKLRVVAVHLDLPNNHTQAPHQPALRFNTLT